MSSCLRKEFHESACLRMQYVPVRASRGMERQVNSRCSCVMCSVFIVAIRFDLTKQRHISVLSVKCTKRSRSCTELLRFYSAFFLSLSPSVQNFEVFIQRRLFLVQLSPTNNVLFFYTTKCNIFPFKCNNNRPPPGCFWLYVTVQSEHHSNSTRARPFWPQDALPAGADRKRKKNQKTLPKAQWTE